MAGLNAGTANSALTLRGYAMVKPSALTAVTRSDAVRISTIALANHLNFIVIPLPSSLPAQEQQGTNSENDDIASLK